MGITPSRLQHEIDSLSTLNYAESFALGRVCVHTTPAPYKTGDDTLVNEDAFLIEQLSEETVIIAVADGVGGSAKGQDASALMIKHLRDAILNMHSSARIDGSQLREPVLNAIERCNEALLKEGTGSATTLIVAVVHANEVRPYHVGDSSLLVSGQRGVIKQRSVSHSPVGFGLEAGFLDDDEAMHHEHSHLLLNLIGSAEMRIEVGAPFQLARFDTLMLCSDGLTDNLSVDDIVNTIRAGSLDKAMGSLVSTCSESMHSEVGHPDDLTVALFRRDH